MNKRVLVDSDVILDVALARVPFFDASKAVLAMLESNYASGFITSSCFGNLYYILRKAGGEEKARLFLSELLKYISVITVSHSNILQALKSEFSDLEDALQNFSALTNQCECIVTRNTKDFTNSELNIYSPGELLKLYQELT